jgi:hypothetical protein
MQLEDDGDVEERTVIPAICGAAVAAQSSEKWSGEEQ